MKRLLITMFALAGAFFVSCLRDGVDDTRPVQKAKSAFTLRVSLEGINAEAVTRTTVVPSAGEEDIQDLCLLFFDESPVGSGVFADAVILTAPDGSPFRMNDDIPVSFDGKSLSETQAYNVLIVANGGAGYFSVPTEDWAASFAGMTETRVYNTTRVTVTGAEKDGTDDDTHAIDPGKILMTGRAAYSPGNSTVTSTLIRAVARYDVINSQNRNFTLASASVWNAFPTASVFGGGEVDYSTPNVDRLGRYYGVRSHGGADIVGGLYSFENRVVIPAVGDEVTTCLIVGISPNADTPYIDGRGQGQVWTVGDVKYYRVNINSTGGSQSLKRNNVYRLTIRGVTGPGYGTEGEAYQGTGNYLSYVINYWDLDDDGLVVYDGTNLLSIPTKTVNLDPGGEKRELGIFTFGTGALAIKRQNFNGSDRISATLNGNTLIIDAKPLDIGETERTGFVELSFAGLTATINVLQNSNGSMYLKVITPTASGIPVFEASSWYPSGIIAVQASGPWTATIHSGGFTFGNGMEKTTLTSAEVPNGQFQIYTGSMNQSTEPREAFVLIKLDENPDNFNAVLLLAQKGSGAIRIKPEGNVLVFNADTTLDTSGKDNLNSSTIHVYPSSDGGVIPEWGAELIRYSSTSPDDTDKFEIYGIEHTTTPSGNNRFGVRPVGKNAESRDYRARLRIFLTDAPSVHIELDVIQRVFDMTNNTVAPVGVNGGMSEKINFTTSMNVRWKFLSVDTYTTTTPLVLNYHDAVVYDDANNLLAAPDINARAMTEGIRVAFPKVYFPNRDKVIRADVTLAIVDANNPNIQLTKYVVTVEQDPLTAKPIIAGSMYSGYSSINADEKLSYFNYFRIMITNKSVFGIGKPVSVGPFALPTSDITTRAISDNINYLNVNTHDYAVLNDAQFQSINTWRQNEGVLLFTASPAFVKSDYLFTNSNSILNELKITANGNLDRGLFGTDNVEARTVNTTNTSNTRIGQFVTINGVFPFTPGTMNLYYADGSSAAANISAVTDKCRAVALIGLKNNKVGLFIDPANRIVFIGDGQFMSNETSGYRSAGNANALPTSDYDKFLANIAAYVAYTAAYGSNFSDLLVDGFTLPAPWNTPLPPPWDSSWE